MLNILQVDPRNDPRPITQNPLSNLDHHHPHRRHSHDSDSDPGEPNIDEHFADVPPGFFGRRTILRSPERPSLRNAGRAAPDDGEFIIRRFTEMLGDIGGGPPPIARSGPGTVFPDEDGGPPQFTYRGFSGPGFRGGVSSVTFTTGPMVGRIRHTGMGQGPPGDEDFTRYNFLPFHVSCYGAFSSPYIMLSLDTELSAISSAE